MTSPSVPSVLSVRAGDRLGPFWALAFVSLGVETALWLPPLWSGAGWTLALAGHGLCVMAGLGGILNAVRRGRDTRGFRLLALAVGFWGPFGAAGCLLHGGLLALFLRRPVAFAEWYDSLFPDETEGLAERVHAAIVGGRDENPVLYRVDPFLDVLRLGTERQKFEVLGRIAARYDPRFQVCLRYALVDPSNNVRVMAATVLVRLQNEGRERLRARATVAVVPGASFEVLLDAARAHDEYAFFSPADDSVADGRREALRLLEMCAALRPDEAEIAFLQGRLLLRLNRVDEAVAALLRCRALGDSGDRTRGWLMEGFFRQGAFAEVQALACERAGSGEEDTEAWTGGRAFWSVGARAA